MFLKKTYQFGAERDGDSTKGKEAFGSIFCDLVKLLHVYARQDITIAQ